MTKTAKGKKVTLQSIADRVGVTKGLVSLALSGSALVNEKTRAEIILAALEMGYDIKKRKISQSRTRMFSLVVSDSSYLNTFFWGEVIKGMVSYLSTLNINLDLVVFKDRSESDGVLLNLVDQKAEGLIVIAGCDRSRIGALSKSGLPIVVVDGDNYYGTGCDCVMASNYISAYSAARYLVKKGHRSIAFVGNTDLAISFKQRAAGFRDGAKFPDISVDHHEICTGGSFKQPYFDERRLDALLRRERRPTAIMCANDYTACEVYEFLKKKKLSVPEDISLIGFDNINIDHELIPRLTTFDIPKQEMGKMAVELMEERIRDPEKPKKIVEVIATIVERDSVLDLSGERT